MTRCECLRASSARIADQRSPAHAKLGGYDVFLGGRMVNDLSAFRRDHTPDGGVKCSGAGRERLRCAIGELIEPKLLTF